MIKINNLTKRFDQKTAVEGLNLEIKQGEIFGLLGENGAGKTTTLRMLATMLKPTEGSIQVCGFDTVKEDEKVRENIGILFGGETGLYDRLTARENIEYFGKLYDMNAKQLKEQINHLAEILDMKDYIDKRVGTFSKGMKQKVAFARSIVQEPKVLLLDEPTSGLDVTASVQVHDFIEESKKNGKTIIFSSHTMEEVQKLCDRVAIIHKGKIKVVDTLENLKKDNPGKTLEEIFTKYIQEGGNQNEL